MRIARVILDIDTNALDSAYFYSAPETLDGLAVGCAVLVPFGRKVDIGFVVEIRDYDDKTDFKRNTGFDASKLKDIKDVLSKAYFNEDAAACVEFLSKRYLAPLSRCVRLFVPPGGVPRIKRNGYAYHIEEASVGEIDDRWVIRVPESDFRPKQNAFKQRAILSALENGDLRVAELSTEYGAVSAALKSLEAQGAIRIERRRRMRGMQEGYNSGQADYASFAVQAPPKPKLTNGQQEALDVINAALEQGDGRVVLVDGVTGSGKTEVYLRAIEKVLQAGKTAIVLVPEISLTPQTVARFRGRFGDMIAVLHSAMSLGERYDQWDYIRSGQARVVIGARSALFSPVKDLGLVVIDEEHETSYKQDSAPRYVSRDVAAWMVRNSGATLVLGSATPSIEALYQAAKNEYWTQVSLPERANGKAMPQIEVVDMAAEFAGGERLFSRKLMSEIEASLRAKHKVVLLLNQRGFAKFLLCRECGYVPECPNCSTSLTYHEQGNKLICHHCGHMEFAPVQCPSCSSPYLKKFGAGTQRVEAELFALLEQAGIQAPIIRMDADTTRTKGAHQKLLESFGREDAAVLLGTQMIAKGLDFNDVTLVGVIDADTQLRLPDFRAAERTFDLIEQVAGRAGRAELEGKVIVQSYMAQSIPIQAASRYDRKAFLLDEIPKRKALKYPPYVRLVNVRAWGKNESEVKQEIESLYTSLQDYLHKKKISSWIMLPPNPCVLAKLNNAFHYHIVIKAPMDSEPGLELEELFRGRKSHKTVNFAVDIDPTSLL
ncbi:MAG: primosomal protein N' [Eggerthellaceae bacterium]|nr:primosomal protein N' [Eggerthellaceae bacterium]